MRHWRSLVNVGVALAVFLGVGAPAQAAPAQAAPAQPLVIGIDHIDPANQQPFPPFNRVFEYTDFFSRFVTIHSGDTIDFREAPGAFHIVALASDEAVARAVYPVAFADTDNDGADIAAGSGAPKVVFGPSNFPITGGSTSGGGDIAVDNGFGPPVCGVAALGEQPCSFRGGNDIEVLGPEVGFDASGAPAFLDQLVKINAPPGTYRYFCYIHPGMDGTLTVAPSYVPATQQATIDTLSQGVFQAEQASALATERAANVVRYTGGAPGTRTYQVSVGAVAAAGKVAIDEMFPNQPLNLAPGDRVQYAWRDPHNVHSVVFPANTNLPEPFGFDCGTNAPGYIGIPTIPGAPPPAICFEPGSNNPEGIGDPGNAPPGTALRDPSALVDAGIRVGTAYNVSPSSQAWQIVVDGKTAPGSYVFQCTVHDWMQGTLNVPS